MSEPISAGPFSLGDWDWDCEKLKSIVTPPPINPLTKEIPNSIGANSSAGGTVFGWLSSLLSGIFLSPDEEKSATEKMKQQLGKHAGASLGFQGSIFAAGYTVPCDPKNKQRVGWHWYLTLTVLASADVGVASGNGYVTVQLGPFGGGFHDCDCAKHALAPRMEIHEFGETLVLVRVPAGSLLEKDGIAHLPMVVVHEGENAGATLLAAVRAPRVLPSVTLVTESATPAPSPDIG